MAIQWGFSVLLGLGVIVSVLVGYRIKKQQAAAVPRRQVEIVVGVTKPLRKDLDVKLAYTADVLPNEQVAIFPKVSGYIVRLGAELGDFVKPGQMLVEIEALELNAAVEQARAAEERFPRTIAPIDDDAPPRREARAQ